MLCMAARSISLELDWRFFQQGDDAAQYAYGKGGGRPSLSETWHPSPVEKCLYIVKEEEYKPTAPLTNFCWLRS